MWYAVQVAAGREEATCRLMERLVNRDVLQEAFTPRYKVQQKFQGAWRMRRSVLFPGYVVAVTDDIDRLRRSLRGVPEFTRVLTMGETYLPLEDCDRAWIEALTRKGDRTVQMSTAVVEGDRVVVTDGPLVGREGWIASVNRHKDLAFLDIELFGRRMRVKVGLAIVARRPSESSEDGACRQGRDN